ncbi:DROUGHT SENSITIVE 1 [Striga hermonthica]|uniref:WD repeat-containing protein 76 n=1 Tax=Striga hermonthica TaxID=68872 RepID=A0A9N7N3Y9_STRHE|nr:DROUGHT SENSITIVE 1 [Striga hermonthica]
MLAALKIRSTLNDLYAANKRQRAECKSYKRSPLKKPKPETPVVLRRSLRTRGVPPDAATAAGLDDDLVDEKQIKDISHLSSNKKSPRRKGPLPLTDAYRGDDGLEYKLKETFSFSWKSLQGEGDGVPCDFKDVEKLNVTKKMRGAVDVTALELRPENVARLVPGRIMNVRFFPTLDMQMVVVGNKFGDIGFWNVNGERTGDDGIYLFHPHSGPVSGITIDPFSISKMYSSCYDGFIRMMDVEKEVFDLIHFSESSIFSTCLSPHDVKSLYFSEGGAVRMLDVRAGKCLLSCDLHVDRVNTIDFSSENENVMATSSTDSTACIWDLRRLNANKPTPLKTVNHRRAVHSAFFSPTGKFLATTSLDDKVGLSTGANYENTYMMSHFNQTGRWISTFRGIWGWDDSSIFIGNMKRGIDVISIPDKKTVATLKSDLMTAIPCRFDAHPYYVGMLAGATGGGQVYIWNPNP